MTPEQKTDKELQAIGFQTAVLDEVHRCQSPKSQWTRAAWAVAERCRYRIGLTGTPIQDNAENLYGPLHALFPEEYGTKTAYVERYLEIDYNDWGGREVIGLHPLRAKEFRDGFHCISRRLTKEAAGLKLPPKVFQTRWVTLSPKLRKAYDGMKDRLIAELETSTMSAANQLVRAGRLTQLANASGEMDADGKFHMSGESPKIDSFLDDLDNGDFEGSQVIVFADSRQLIEMLSDTMTKKKIEHVKITGGVTGDDRQAAMDAFQEGKVQFCLLTRVGGEGITLTAANIMVRLMRPWSFTIHSQVEDRCHRIGSGIHSTIMYIDYVSEDTIEEQQIVRLNAKEARAQEVLQDGELLAMLKAKEAS